MQRFAEGEDDRNKVVSALARIEARSAISRLCKSHRVMPAESILLLDMLAAEARRMIEQPINPPVLEAAGPLIDRHDLRTLDAIQLGSAIVARDLMFASDMRLIASDKALLEAARKEGFRVWNPAEL